MNCDNYLRTVEIKQGSPDVYVIIVAPGIPLHAGAWPGFPNRAWNIFAFPCVFAH